MKRVRLFSLLGILLCLGVIFYIYFKEEALKAIHSEFRQDRPQRRKKGPRPDITIINLPLNIKGSSNALTVDIALNKDSKISVYKPCIVKFLLRDSKNKLLKTQTGELGAKQSLDIPSKGEFSVTVEVEDYAGDIIARRTVVYKNGNPTNLSSDNEAPKILAIASFLDFTGTVAAHVIVTIAARDRVVSDLTQNYDCVIISRSNGLALSSESSLNKFNAASEGKNLGFIPAADYSVIGHFTRGIVLDNGYLDNFICNIFTTNLKGDAETIETRDTFQAEYRTGYNEELVPAIAKRLNLKPKKRFPKKVDGQLEETWAVLPFTTLFGGDGFAEAKTNNDLSMKMELALQESGKVKNIVDHSEINKVMNELKLSLSDGISESTAAGIAGILGADRVITGQVSKVKFRGDNRLRIDLILIDGKKAVVLDAGSAIFKAEFLDKASSILLMNFTGKKYRTPDLSKQPQAMKTREAAIYMKFIEGISRHVYNNMAVRNGLNLTESAYMLVKDQPVQRYKLSMNLLYDIIDQYPALLKKKENKRLRNRATSLMKLLLKGLTHSKETPKPLLELSYAFYHVGNYEKSKDLAEKYLRSNPQTVDIFAYFLIGSAFFESGDYGKAAECAEKSKNKIGGLRLGVKSYKKLGNERKELEFLDELGEGYYSTENAVDSMKLIRKIKGPEKALEKYDELSTIKRAKPEIQLELAKCYMALNDKVKALLILETLNDETKLNSDESFKGDKKKFLAGIRKLLAGFQDINIQWKTPAQIRKVPDKYKLYIRPIGAVDMGIINEAAKKIEKSIGVKVVILPDTPIPDDSACYSKKRGQYDVDYVRDRLIRVLPVPNDAIMLVNVTYKDIFVGSSNFTTISSYLGSGSIVSYARWGGVLKNEYSGLMEKAITHCYLHFAFACAREIDMDNLKNGRLCKNLPCVATYSNAKNQLVNKRYEMCPECQEEYKKVDFSRMHYLWQNMKDYLYSPNETKSQRLKQYREKVEKYLREQKK